MPNPSLVVETGWSESRPELYQDRDVWLIGGAATTKILLILKWTKVTQNRVKGDLEM